MEDTKKVTRVGLVGLGFIAEYHYNALRRINGVTVAAVCDKNFRIAEQFAKNKNINKAYESIDKMLEKEDLDIVHVLTQPDSHCKIGKKVIEHGLNLFIEKPMCTSVAEAKELLSCVETIKNVVIGTNHNFLFAEPYRKLKKELELVKLYKINQIEIVWRKKLAQLDDIECKSWMFAEPQNIIFEVFPHSIAHVLDLVGTDITCVDVDNSNPSILGNNKVFYKLWEIKCEAGNIKIRIIFDFDDNYEQHYIDIRGENAVAHVDFINNSYTIQEHKHEQVDLDILLNSIRISLQEFMQAVKYFGKKIASRIKGNQKIGLFAESITESIKAFYSSIYEKIDYGSSSDFSLKVIQLCQEIAAMMINKNSNICIENRTENKGIDKIEVRHDIKILVTGATGFIGSELVKKLYSEGYAVRVIARSKKAILKDFIKIGVDIIYGDLMDNSCVDRAINGIDYVYHLSRGSGPSWNNYLTTDYLPTKYLSEACASHNITLIYVSSIDVYSPWNKLIKIKDDHKPHKGRIRTNNYAKIKAKNERIIKEIQKKKGLSSVIIRPGIVIGRGGDPFHMGIASFAYGASMCTIIGSGNNTLPLVLLDDCVSAMINVLEKKDVIGKSFNIVGEGCLTANEYIDELEMLMKIKIKRKYRSAMIVYIEELIKWSIKKLSRKKEIGFPSYTSVKGKSFVGSFNNTNIRKELAWQPESGRDIIVKKGIEESVLKYKKN